jgi:ubiquinone/menaquinone biosynthesis C-methylase UbiE
MTKTSSDRGIGRRIGFVKSHPVWRSQYTCFVNAISSLSLPSESTAVSVSCGDGTWDFLAFAHNRNLKKMIAVDVVDCPVAEADIRLLNTKGEWSFQKIAPDNALPFSDNSCELVLHQDVIEHTTKPYLLLAENHRLLKPGGFLLFGTPNIFRPANIMKLLLGKLTFPWFFVNGAEKMTHVQEFNAVGLKLMLEEIGFDVLSINHCFFGVSFLKINIRDFPAGNLGRNLCQYLFFVAQKRTP